MLPAKNIGVFITGSKHSFTSYSMKCLCCFKYHSYTPTLTVVTRAAVSVIHVLKLVHILFSTKERGTLNTVTTAYVVQRIRGNGLTFFTDAIKEN